MTAFVACQASLEIKSRGSMTDMDKHGARVCMHVIMHVTVQGPFFVLKRNKPLFQSSVDGCNKQRGSSRSATKAE